MVSMRYLIGGWNGRGASSQVWTLIMLAAAVCIASAVSLTRRDATYMLVLTWAFIGIGLKHNNLPSVSIGSWTAVGIMGLMMFAGQIVRKEGEPSPIHL